MKTKYIIIISKLVFVIFIIGCNPTKRISDNSYLLKKNKLLVYDKIEVDKSEIYNLLQQKPNRKVLFFLKFHLWLYNQANPKKNDRFNNWLRNIGEEPVILDDSASKNSIKNIKKFLFNKGYFNANVTDTTFYDKKRKMATVLYTIKAGKPYKYRFINYYIEDSLISGFLLNDSVNRLINSNQRFDTDKLEEERTRITNLMRRSGFYDFVKEYITFEADTSIVGNYVDLTIIIKSPVNPNDSTKKLNHKIYFVRKINVYPDYNNYHEDDSLIKNIVLFKDYTFNYLGERKFKERALAQNIFIRKDYIYDYTLVEKTYLRFLETQAFRFIDIEFKKMPHDSDMKGKPYPLMCNIKMMPLQKQYYSIEAQGTNSEGNLGMAANINYNHRNLLKGVEKLSMYFYGEMEFQKNFQGSDNINEFLPFNTYKYGFEIKLIFPKFILPIRQEKVSKNAVPKTTTSVGYNVQFRKDFQRSIFNISFGYEWKESLAKKHSIFPVDVNIVNVVKTPEFETILNNLQNIEIINSYQNHLVPGMRYTFTYNNQVYRPNRNFTFLRISAESAGNLFRIINTLSKSPYYEEKYYKIFNIRYNQFFKTEADLRYYQKINKFNNIVYRLRTGIGYAYGNTSILPFEKSFFLGGANSIRAWPIYSLGPGSYRETFTTKTADIVIESNIEWRFSIYKLLKGSSFIDAGNIWFTKLNPEKSNSEFNFNRFYKEIAIGSGIGFRLDFNFFVLRFDLGVKIYDPSLHLEDRFVISKFFSSWKKHVYKEKYDSNTPYNYFNFNIGIGYPF